jgi:hypothetical protein
MAPSITTRGPTSFKEWLSTNFWWGVGQDTIGPSFSKDSATTLYQAGLRWNRNAWDYCNHCIISGVCAMMKFRITEEECRARVGIRQRLTGMGAGLER